MSHCTKCGEEVDPDDEFCSECGAKTKHKKKGPEEKTKVVEKIVETHVHERTSGSGLLKFAIFVLVVVIIGFIVFAVIESGALDEIFEGSGIAHVDPCERQFSDCNHACGEGWGNELCKTGCTFKYNQCKK